VSPVSPLSLILCPCVPPERAAVTRWGQVARPSVLQALFRTRRRATSGPLKEVIRGLSRILGEDLIVCSGDINRTESVDSQADSAGSIPVTRSNVKLTDIVDSGGL
jgi:hypothetical protein